MNSNVRLQQELTEYNGGQDFDGLEHFTYNNSRFVDLLFGHLNDTNFDGITVCEKLRIVALTCTKIITIIAITLLY